MTQRKESCSSSPMKSTGKSGTGSHTPHPDGRTPVWPLREPEEESPTTCDNTMTQVEYAWLRELETLYESLHTLMSQRSYHPIRMNLSYSPFLNEGTIELRFYSTETLAQRRGLNLSQGREQSSTVLIPSVMGKKVIRDRQETRS